MISNYERNQQKYKEVIQYTNTHENLSQELKKDMLKIREKYRICISCMEENEIYDLIEQCVIKQNHRPLKNELYATIFGTVPSREDDDTEKENYLY